MQREETKILSLALLLGLVSLGFAATKEEYHVKETDAGITIQTPYGEKNIPKTNPEERFDSYKIAIPLKDLKPEEEEPIEELAEEEPKKEEPPPAPPPTPAPAPVAVTPPPTPPAEPKREICEADEEDEPEEEPKPVPAPPPPLVSKSYDNSDELILEANWLFNHRRFFEASTVVERILSRDPNSVRGWTMKGSLLYVQGEKALAIKAWKSAQLLEPTNVEIKNLLERYR